MKRVKKANAIYKIDDRELTKFKALGYREIDDKDQYVEATASEAGKVALAAKEKALTEMSAQYAALEAQNKALAAENEAIKAHTTKTIAAKVTK